MPIKSISNSDNIIDSRDVIARITELRYDADASIEKAEDLRELILELQAEQKVAEEDEDACEDLDERIDAIEVSLWTASDGTELTDDFDEADYEELLALEKFAEDGESYSSDWSYGTTLVNEDYFERYAAELADDIGAIDGNANWPLNHIDWEAAAEELKQDYSEISWNGNTFFVRD